MRRCRCIARGCGQDPEGKLLTRRDLKLHATADAQRARQALAEDFLNRQSAALRRQDEDIEMALADRGTYTLPPAVPYGGDNLTEFDRERKFTNRASYALERISALRNDLPTYPPYQTSYQTFTERISTLKRLEKEATELGEELALLGTNGNWPSFRMVFDNATSEHKKYLAAISQMQDILTTVRYARHTGYRTDHLYDTIFPDVKPIIQLVLLMVVVSSVILRLSRRGCAWLLTMAHRIIQVALLSCFGHIDNVPPYLRAILSQFPKDVRTVTEKFNLEGKSTVFAICPSCHSIFPPTYEDNLPTYPEQCDFKRFTSDAETCGSLLVRTKTYGGHAVKVPIKPYISYDFKDWLANLLSRPGHETMMDNAWNEMELPEDSKMTSIFQGAILRDFKGPDGTHFSVGSGEGRYVFSLGFDFFNPLTNKQAGKHISVGVISLVCLNLPMEHRYKPENMFVAGIVPGPKEPPLDRINPYVSPIVDALLEFWEPGVLYTRTHDQPEGRIVRCALVAVVCDLLAARKIGGFAACKHIHWCAVCRGTSHDHADFNVESWERRTNDDCRAHAESFRKAEDAKAADSIFDQTGLRWSELLRLPYFDPSRFIVIDSMHNLFLGLIKEHFTTILGFKLTGPSKSVLSIIIPVNPTNPFPSDEKDIDHVNKIVAMLEKPIPDEESVAQLHRRLKTMRLAALTHVAKGLSSIESLRKKTKENLANLLVEWRKTRIMSEIANDDDLGEVFTQAEMGELWMDIGRMVTPSWVTSIPSNLGVSGGKLKADQWRTFGSIYLPLTIIRMWSNSVSDTPRDRRRRDLLQLTISLISAVNVITSREVSIANTEQYVFHMKAYRTSLATLFPKYVCHPNHHQAMHLAEYVLLFGPVHGWWTFPFERMIGMLQRVSTNYKQGEYERTIGHYWHLASNLRTFFGRLTCPQPIRQCTEAFIQLVTPAVRDTLTTDMLAFAGDENEDAANDILGRYHLRPSAQTIPAGIRQMFDTFNIPTPAKADFYTSLTIRGLRYGIRTKHQGNSQIYVRDTNGVEVPASIENILRFENSPLKQSWLVVRLFEPITLQCDPFLEFPAIRAKMWSPTLGDRYGLIRASVVESHFAKCIIPWENKQVAVVLSLSRTLLASHLDLDTEMADPSYDP